MWYVSEVCAFLRRKGSKPFKYFKVPCLFNVYGTEYVRGQMEKGLSSVQLTNSETGERVIIQYDISNSDEFIHTMTDVYRTPYGYRGYTPVNHVVPGEPPYIVAVDDASWRFLDYVDSVEELSKSDIIHDPEVRGVVDRLHSDLSDVCFLGGSFRSLIEFDFGRHCTLLQFLSFCDEDGLVGDCYYMCHKSSDSTQVYRVNFSNPKEAKRLIVKSKVTKAYSDIEKIMRLQGIYVG